MKQRMPQIRPARLDGAEALATVHVQSWQAAYVGLIPQDYLDNLNVARRIGDSLAYAGAGPLKFAEPAYAKRSGICRSAHPTPMPESMASGPVELAVHRHRSGAAGLGMR